MTTVKRAVTIDEDLEREARELSGGNFSAFVNEALARQVRAAKLDRLVHADETQRGAVPADVQARVDAEIAALDSDPDRRAPSVTVERLWGKLRELGLADTPDAPRRPDLMDALEASLANRVEEIRGDSEDELVSNAKLAVAEAVKRVAEHHRQIGVTVVTSGETQDPANVTATIHGTRRPPSQGDE